MDEPHYGGILRQMGDAKPNGPIDLSASLSFDLFDAIADRLRTEGKLVPFSQLRWHMLYNDDGVCIGSLQRQNDGTWRGNMLAEDGTLVPISKAADDAPIVIEDE